MPRLQEFGFEQSPYERPNQKWICGRAREGKCCLSGPDARGNCTATTECRPLRKGDHWYCTRPSFLGGACAEGPLPDGQCCRPIPKCCPVRSLRAWRGTIVLLAVAVTLATLLLAFASEHGNALLSPGQLSFAHRSMADNCSDCHGGVMGRPAKWVAAGAGSLSAHDNSGLCLKCHNVGESPLQPHSLEHAHLQPLTVATFKKNGPGHASAGLMLASFISSVDHSADNGLACATCHKEHRGKEADLKKLSNNQCQNCHVTQFTSLAHGHPQFTRYPFNRRTRIIFDHESHFRDHFKNPAWAQFAPGSCVDCHQTDLRGGTMLIKPFEAVCASCHDDQIKGKGAVTPGIVFISFPTLDDRALTGKYAIGEWPDEDNQPLSPFVSLLLSGDPKLREAMDKLQGVDLSSLPKADSEKLQAAQTLAWGMKGLIFDLGVRGQDELIWRINRSLGRTLTDSEKEGVVAFLSPETLRAIFRGAFPHLQKEVLDYRGNAKAASTKLIPAPDSASSGFGVGKSATPDAWVSQGGWYSPDDGTSSLYYRPRGHRDRFLSSWMNLMVDTDHAADPPVSQAVFKKLTAPKAVGLCAKCHSIDDQPGNHVNWTALQPDSMEHGFNRFSHSAHLSLLDTQGCLTCHHMAWTDSKTKDTYASAFQPGQHDPSTFHSNFQTIDKAVCVSCHQPKLVRDDCLLCHNYHVGRFKPIVAHAGIVPALPSAATP